MPAASQPPPVPPTKANLKSWWNHFNFVQKVKHDAEAHIGTPPLRPPQRSPINRPSALLVAAAGEPVHTVFGKPLKESLRYASVQISTANAGGDLYVWGYIPVVVAKWYVAALSACPPCTDRPAAVSI